MSTPAQRPLAVFRLAPPAFWLVAFAALLLQAVLPLEISFAKYFDFPLVITIYFSLARRNRIFGIALGAGMGLMQDAFSHGFIGILGMSKAIVGYLAATASSKFDLEQLVPRLTLAALLILAHDLFLFGLQHVLLETYPPFDLMTLLLRLLANVAWALILFQALDRLPQPT